MQMDFLAKNVLGFISSTYQGVEPSILGKENGKDFFDIAGLSVDTNKQNKQIEKFYDNRDKIDSQIKEVFEQLFFCFRL